MTWTQPTNMMKQRLQTCFVNSSAPRLTRASVQVCEARTGWLVDIIFPTTLHHREVRERHQYRRNVHVQAQPRRRPPLPRCGSVLLSMAFFQRVTVYLTIFTLVIIYPSPVFAPSPLFQANATGGQTQNSTGTGTKQVCKLCRNPSSR